MKSKLLISVFYILVFYSESVFSKTDCSILKTIKSEKISGLETKNIEEKYYFVASVAKNEASRDIIVKCSFLISREPNLWRYFSVSNDYKSGRRDFKIETVKNVVDSYRNYFSNTDALGFQSIGKSYIEYAYMNLLQIYIVTSIGDGKGCDKNEVLRDIKTLRDYIGRKYPGVENDETRSLLVRLSRFEASCYYAIEEYNEARKVLESILLDEKISALEKMDAYFGVAHVYTKQGNYDKAITFIQSATKIYFETPNLENYYYRDLMSDNFDIFGNSKKFVELKKGLITQ